MKRYKNVYRKLCSSENICLAYLKAKKGKSKKLSVVEFDKDFKENLENLKTDLENMNYRPRPLKKFIVRDPKTRTIHASAFRDRIVHHAVINILDPIFEKIFIYDFFASRKDKGTHPAIQRFDYFKRKVSQNGLILKTASSGGGANNFIVRDYDSIQGYCLKADIKHYFDSVDHEVLISILRKKIKDGKFIWLVRLILKNFDSEVKGKGMPLGNYTSQFFANVYLNELDYFVKHELKAKYYIRYVDDFVILHRSKKRLEYFKIKIIEFLKNINLELHPDKSKIIPLRKGVTFLGYRVFYYHKLLRKRNIRIFIRKFKEKLDNYDPTQTSPNKLIEELQGWFGYAKWANTYKIRKNIIDSIVEKFNTKDEETKNKIYEKL